jgi:uncharacterized protein (TIGR02265 family)
MLSSPKTSSQQRRPPPLLSRAELRFVEPNWYAPLDVGCAVPKGAQVAGMFFLALQAKADQMNFKLSVVRPRYLQFNFYPLTELIPLMVEAATHLYPGKPPREAMRSMGRAVPKALVASTLGKVVFGSTEGVHAAAEAMTKAYGINLRPSRAEVIESAPNWMVVELKGVHHFLDSHHVGVFEGVMLHAGVEGTVRIASVSNSVAEFLLTW